MKGFKKYLASEIGIEFKACLYFFAFLFYVCCCLFATGETQVPMLHMAEMILSTYILGYVQVFLLNNFEEAETLSLQTILYILLCSLIYAVLDYFLGWTCHSIPMAIGFFLYACLCFFSVYLIYKFRRNMETENLNMELMNFKALLEKEESENE